MSMGERIRTRRQELGLSQNDVAQAVGYTDRSTISKIESGECNPLWTNLEQIAKTLSCSPAWLAGWSDDPKAEPIQQNPEGVSHADIQLTVPRRAWNPKNLTGVVRIAPEAEIALLKLCDETGLSKSSVASELIMQAAKVVKIISVEE